MVDKESNSPGTTSYRGIYYQRFGNPVKPAVLFLHGFLGSQKDWQQVVDIVAKYNFCITLDLPGHGNSSDPDLLKNIWDFKSLAVRINDMLLHLGINKVGLVGYSMGGRIAQYFAVHFPEKLSKLVLESSSPGIKNKNEKIARLQEDKKRAQDLQNKPLSKFLNHWYNLSLFEGIKNHPQYAEMIKQRMLNDPHLLAKALRAFSVANQPYLEEKLSALRIPVFLMCGEKDKKYVDIMKSLKQRNPGFKLSVIDKSGHNIHLEKPILFAEHLVEFLSL